MKSKRIIFLWSWILCGLLCADQQEAPKPAYTPWYTGTLEATSAGNASPGQLVIQPYFSTLYWYGTYDARWKVHPLDHKKVTLAPQLFIQFGLTDRIDFNIEPTMVTSFQNGQTETLLTDLYTGLGFQILRDIPGTWVPDFRIVFQVDFPTGKFEQRDIQRLDIAFSGTGGHEVGMLLAVRKAFYYFPNHPFRLMGNLGLTGFSDVAVDGPSIYGGNDESFGTIHPGTRFFMYFTGEFSLTQRWVLAFEYLYGYLGRNRFVGKSFEMPFQFDERMRFQFIPELEYNWSDNSGFIGGISWQFLGYNQSAFTALILSAVYTY